MVKEKTTTTDVAVKPEETTTVATITTEELIAWARNESGEENKGGGNYLTTIVVNNIKTKKTVNIEGVDTEVEVPAKKEFIIKTKEGVDENDKPIYKIESVGETIVCPILKVRYQASAKLPEGSTEQYWMTAEFDSFSDVITAFALNQSNDQLYTGTYKELKAYFNDKVTVAGILYVLINGDLKKVKFTAAGISPWFDYMTLVKSLKRSVTTQNNVLSVVSDMSGSVTYNKIAFAIHPDEIGMEEMQANIAAQAELKKLMNLAKAEVMPAEEEASVEVSDIPFN